MAITPGSSYDNATLVEASYLGGGPAGPGTEELRAEIEKSDQRSR